MSTTNKNLKVVTVKNALETLDGKYTGKLVTTDTSYLDDIVESICATRSFLDAPTVKLAIRALASEINKEVGGNFRYVTTGTLVAFAPAISGSVATMDAALDPAENALYVNIVSLDSLRSAAAAIVPLRDIAKSTIAIDRVEDALTLDFGAIHGTSAFIVSGLNLSATKEGESLTLLKADGSVASAAVVSEGGNTTGERITASLETAVDPGEYVLRLVSFGFSDPTATPGTFTRKVVVKE